MAHLTQHQIDALRRVEEAFLHDAREVELGVPGGFGRHQVVEHLAATLFRDRRVLVVVPHPARIAHAFEAGLGAGNGRRVGLVLSDSEVEVASLPSALRLARGGRLSHGAIVLDGIRPDQADDAESVVRACAGAQVVRLSEAAGAEPGPGGVSFPVRIVSSREPDGPAGPRP